MNITRTVWLIFSFASALVLMLSLPSPLLAQGKPGKAAPMMRIPLPGSAEHPLFPASEFSNSRSTFDLNLPAGWRAVEIPNPQKNSETTLTFIEGPGMPAPNCRVTTRTPKQPPKITQAQINKIMHDDRNVQMVRKNIGQGGREIQTISKITSGGVNGLQARVLVPGNDRRVDTTILLSFFETVGLSYSFECTVQSADMDNFSDDLEAILKGARFSKS